jgi:hypothetical protein
MLMNHSVDKQHGFGLIVILTIAAMVAVIVVGGWYVWSKNRPNVSNKDNTTLAQTDPYTSWKSYCDSVKKVCFKYPADWTVDADGNGATLQNPNKTIFVSYANNDTRDGAAMPYYAAVIEDLASTSTSFKVLGGYAVPASGDIVPQIKVVDAKFTTGLTAGRQGSATNTARFTNTDGSTGHLEAYPSSTSGYDTSKAKAWFESADGKLAELVIQSFYIQ